MKTPRETMTAPTVVRYKAEADEVKYKVIKMG